MKKIIFGLMAGLGALGFQTARGQANPYIDISPTTTTMAVGATSNFLVHICNTGPSAAIVANKLRPQISTGSTAMQIVGVTDVNGNPLTDWTVLALSGNNVRLLYTQPLAVLTCVDFYVKVQGISTSTGPGEPIVASMGFHGPQPPGNNVADDGSATTMLVTQPLPVKMVAFDAEAKGCNAALSWETADEQNSDYYGVEYSTDAKTFKQVGQVKSDNSAAGGRYSFTYDGLVGGANYFRLRLVDLDGSYRYSNTARLTSDCAVNTAIIVAPNPATDQVKVSGLGDAPSRLVLIDAVGRLVSQVQATGNEQTLDVSSFATGIYTLRVSGADGSVKATVRISKR